MSKKAKKKRMRTYIDLAEMAVIDDRARNALERYHAIKAKHRHVEPEIWYSDFNGWKIVDPLEFPGE